MKELFFYDSWKKRVVTVKIKRETKKLYLLEERSNATGFLERIHKDSVDKEIAFTTPEKLRTFYLNYNKNKIEKLMIQISNIKEKIKFFSNVRERIEFEYGDSKFVIAPDFDGKFRVNKHHDDDDAVIVNPG